MAGRETEAFSTMQGAMPESAAAGPGQAASKEGSKGAEVEANAEKK